MKVTEKDVKYVADLANLELTKPESKRFLKDLNSILDYIDTLNELDTTSVAPMAQVAARYGGEGKSESERYGYALRADELRPSLPHDAALANAPDTDGTYFKVPKVIER
ncbi:MAG TPA: Asp-tRNA(Asn)/Glu-tRNA(Gln) amidotransferase subunit GatC [Candidatus Koribacter sp.]|jgi:aspartyl-tRNA(Asn)/glutamyl-tRNA(Gln) amidotransferase subunit C